MKMSAAQQKKHDDEMERFNNILRGKLTTRRTCPFCGEDFIEHDTSSDRLGTLGSTLIDGVHYIVPMQVVNYVERLKHDPQA